MRCGSTSRRPPSRCPPSTSSCTPGNASLQTNRLPLRLLSLIQHQDNFREIRVYDHVALTFFWLNAVWSPQHTQIVVFPLRKTSPAPPQGRRGGLVNPSLLARSLRDSCLDPRFDGPRAARRISNCIDSLRGAW